MHAGPSQLLALESNSVEWSLQASVTRTAAPAWQYGSPKMWQSCVVTWWWCLYRAVDLLLSHLAMRVPAGLVLETPWPFSILMLKWAGQQRLKTASRKWLWHITTSPHAWKITKRIQEDYRAEWTHMHALSWSVQRQPPLNGIIYLL